VLSVVALLAVGVGPFADQRVRAAISPLGDVTVVPAGGTVTTTFFVGNSAFGQLSVAPPSGAPAAPTPINVSGANNAIFGNNARVTGIAAFSGFGHNLAVGNDLTLGNAGSGNLSVGLLARVTVNENILLGFVDGSSGRLFINDLGTVVEALENTFVGQAGTGLVQILSGGRYFTTATWLGNLAGSDGTVTVSGNESTWIQSGTMTVGLNGRGFLQVVSQARMETTNATVGSAATGVGAVHISGNGSVWDVTGTMTLGGAGQASMSITEGGRLTSTGATRFATSASSEASAVVSGANTVWNTGTSLTVGDGGVGILRMFTGGRVNAGNTILASNATSRGEVIVDGAGTILDITGTLDVGNVAAAEALLTISSGGVVNASGLTEVAAAGEIFMGGGRLNAGGGLTNQGLVRGAGRINGAFTNSAMGELRTLSNNSLVLGGTLVNNTGLVHLDGGEIDVLGLTTNTGDIDARSAVARFSGGLNNNAGGQFAIVGGNVDVFGNVANAAGATIVVGGEANAVFHDTVTGGGAFHVMPGADVLMLENLSFAPSSLLSFQLNGESSSEDFSPLEVMGQATLAGQLKVQLVDGYAPQLGDTYNLLSTTSAITGTFGTESLPALGAGLQWDVDYSTTSLTLSVVSGPGNFPADFDGDGDVDGADLNEWKPGFGKLTGALKGDGDADADGDVDGSDFLAWQRQLGSGPPATPAVGAVPEPSTVALLAAALVGLAAPARRRIRRLS
jgi:T5SS/PEP-CTERM-associated repeat protein